MTITELKTLKESEDNVEFKEAKNDFNFDGGVILTLQKGENVF